jgi:hypothetical protein
MNGFSLKSFLASGERERDSITRYLQEWHTTSVNWLREAIFKNLIIAQLPIGGVTV